MKDLDDRLREILNDLRAAPNHRAAGAIIDAEAQIKQAFAEAGWHKQTSFEKKVLPQRLRRELMTGQEWLERFGRAFKENLSTFVDFADIDMNIYNSGKEAAVTAALEAAERVSGVSDE